MSPRRWRFLWLLSVSAGALLAMTTSSIADLSEIDAFQRAVTTQSKADALAFFRDFGSSHLTTDLIELLQPNVALEVCGQLSGESAPARAACEKVRKEGLAAAPVVDTPEPPAPWVTTHPAGSTTSSALKIPPTSVVSVPRPPAIAIMPEDAIPPPVAPVKDARAVSSLEQYSGKTTVPAESLPTLYEGETLRKLVARFDLWPFKVEHLDRQRQEVVVAYAGGLGRYVMCGESIGVPKNLDAVENSANRLNSRMVVRLPDGHSGAKRIYVDATHIVSLKRTGSGSLDVINVHLDKPARTSDGFYCWSTGEMERLARMR